MTESFPSVAGISFPPTSHPLVLKRTVHTLQLFAKKRASCEAHTKWRISLEGFRLTIHGLSHRAVPNQCRDSHVR